MEASAEVTPKQIRDQTDVFCVLWTIAHVAHVLRKSQPTEPIAWLILAAAVFVLARPTASWRIGVLAVAQLLYLAQKMPMTDNHGYIMGFANLGLVTAVVMGRKNGFRLPRSYVLATLLISYGAASVAKLNAGFFDIGVSCSVEMLYDAVAAIGLEPGSLRPIEPAMPFLIAAIELAVPLSLIIPGTRRFGVILIVLFHWSLSLSPTATALDFTLVVYSMTFLVLPREAGTIVRERAHPVTAVFQSGTKARYAAFAFLVVFLVVSLSTGWGFPNRNRNWIWLAIMALIFGSSLIALALRLGPGESSLLSTEGRGVPQLVPFALLVLLQVLNVSAPYLGIKTAGSYVMYSNLQTERGKSNHFLIPRLPMETIMDDHVEIVATSNRKLNSIAQRGDLISWHEVRRELSRDPEARISYRRDGALHVHERAHENPELVSRNLFFHKIIGHRAYDPQQPSCRW